MAITNATYVAKVAVAPGDPAPAVILTLDLDASYATGGYADFKATVLAAVKDYIGAGDITIYHVAQNNCPTSGAERAVVQYDRANDKLVCLDPADFSEHTAATDLSVVTGLELVVFYK